MMLRFGPWKSINKIIHHFNKRLEDFDMDSIYWKMRAPQFDLGDPFSS